MALVTGGGRGIGRAIARGLSAAGASVAVLARSADEVQETASLLGKEGRLAIALAADVSQPDELGPALDTIRDRWGAIEILVNNAAVVWPLGPSTALDIGAWENALAINVNAVARLSFALLPPMIEAGWGRIVNVSSGIAANPAGMVRANAYATSKAALEAHTLNLAAELAGTGVSANVFRPGGVDTAMQAWIRGQDPIRIGEDLHGRFVDNYEQGRLLTPEQSAAALLTRVAGDETGEIWSATARPS